MKKHVKYFVFVQLLLSLNSAYAINIVDRCQSSNKDWEAVSEKALNASVVVQNFYNEAEFKALKKFRAPEIQNLISGNGSRQDQKRIAQLQKYLQSGPSFGSGFFIAEDLILTNAHVVQNAPVVHVRPASLNHDKKNIQKSVKAQVILKVDLGFGSVDMALLKLAPESLNTFKQNLQQLGQEFEPLRISSELVRISEELATISNPEARSGVLSSGRVENPQDINRIDSSILVDFGAVNSGSSGSAMFDKAGCVRGLIYAVAGQKKSTMVVPATALIPFLKIYQEASESEQGWNKKNISLSMNQTPIKPSSRKILQSTLASEKAKELLEANLGQMAGPIFSNALISFPDHPETSPSVDFVTEIDGYTLEQHPDGVVSLAKPEGLFKRQSLGYYMANEFVKGRLEPLKIGFYSQSKNADQLVIGDWKILEALAFSSEMKFIASNLKEGYQFIKSGDYVFAEISDQLLSTHGLSPYKSKKVRSYKGRLALIGFPESIERFMVSYSSINGVKPEDYGKEFYWEQFLYNEFLRPNYAHSVLSNSQYGKSFYNTVKDSVKSAFDNLILIESFNEVKVSTMEEFETALASAEGQKFVRVEVKILNPVYPGIEGASYTLYLEHKESEDILGQDNGPSLLDLQ